MHDGDAVFAGFAAALFERSGIAVESYDVGKGGVRLQAGDVPGHVVLNLTRGDIGVRDMNAGTRHLKAYDCIVSDRCDAYGNWVMGEDGTPIMAKAIVPVHDRSVDLFPYARS